jgi:hypothetical protein
MLSETTFEGSRMPRSTELVTVEGNERLKTRELRPSLQVFQGQGPALECQAHLVPLYYWQTTVFLGHQCLLEIYSRD